MGVRIRLQKYYLTYCIKQIGYMEVFLFLNPLQRHKDQNQIQQLVSELLKSCEIFLLFLYK